MLLTRALRGSNMSTILQAETGIQPHPVTLLVLRSSSVQTRQVPRPWERWRGLGWQVGASGVPVGSGAPDIRGELRHLVGLKN